MITNLSLLEVATLFAHLAEKCLEAETYSAALFQQAQDECWQLVWSHREAISAALKEQAIRECCPVAASAAEREARLAALKQASSACVEAIEKLKAL